MKTLAYTVIKTKAQYDQYCRRLESLTAEKKKPEVIEREIELLTLLIEHYDDAHARQEDAGPVALLQYLMQEHQMKAADLARLLGVSPGLVSDILHYKKSFSKQVIRKLAAHFKVSQEAFNRPYALKGERKIRA